MRDFDESSGRNKGAKYISLDQVRKHDKEYDLWMIIYNKVYDVTDFIENHPGGGAVLFDYGGADATEAFVDVGHSLGAFEMLEPYLKGRLHPNEEIKYEHHAYDSISRAQIEDEDNEIRKPISKRRRYFILDFKYSSDEYLICILIFLALLIIALYIFLQKIKWEHQYYHF